MYFVGDGVVHLISGSIELVNGTANDVVLLNSDFTIDGGTVSLLGQVFIGYYDEADFTIVGDSANIQFLCMNMSLENNMGNLNFVLNETGISPINALGWSALSQAIINIDGSAYTGGSVEFDLITSGYLFDSVAIENIHLMGFEENGMSAVVVQDSSGAAGSIKLVITSSTDNSLTLVDGINEINTSPYSILQRDESGFHKGTASAWTYNNGTISNTSTNTGTAESHGAAAIMVNLKAINDPSLNQLELNFDYNKGDANEYVYIHIWGYKENSTHSTSSTFTMNLASPYGNAWEHSDADILIGTAGVFDDYNLGWNGAWDGLGSIYQGQGGGAADFITGPAGFNSYSAIIDLSTFTAAPTLVQDYDYIVIGISRYTAAATSPSLSISNFSLKATVTSN